MTRHIVITAFLVCAIASHAFADSAPTGQLVGRVTDETGGVLPGVTVELQSDMGMPVVVLTSASGEYEAADLPPGLYHVYYSLESFATVQIDVIIQSAPVRADVVLHLSLHADVTVKGTRTFANLADIENPAEDLVGIAQSASQGAITAQQIAERPLMRDAEVLEAVPGLIVAQHSGEGKANQYFLRGFNLDHGTDFATTIAGMPVNMPTHAHAQGYSDINFLIPELVGGIQFSKGPYYADQGNFAAAGASNIDYVNILKRPIVSLEAGGDRYGRMLAAASPAFGAGRLVTALEVAHNDGPWARPDDYQKINALARYSQGDAARGFSVTAMGYGGRWSATDPIAQRAVANGLIGRFGGLDPTDGGNSYRYSLSGEWRRGTNDTLTTVTAYGIGYDFDLFSNFTYFLDDPVHGDQIEQADHRFVTGARVSHRRSTRWGGRLVRNTFGVDVRNDTITNVALYQTASRIRLATRGQDRVLETAAGTYVQNETEWASWLRTMAGLRVDAARYRVTDVLDSLNSGTARAALASPKGGVTLGPWRATEFYVNAGEGYHSNDARGTTMVRGADGQSVGRVTPLVRARGAELGLRTVAVPHLQTTVSLWTLRLDSELVFEGDAGVTAPSRPSERHGIEWTNYYRPWRRLVFDGDLSWSRARFTASDPAGDHVPDAVGTVASAGATVNDLGRAYGGLRWRYFGPRTLLEDASVRSKATSLVNVQAGYRIAEDVRIALNVFNLFNASSSDIDYYYVSRLPGEPLGGLADWHFHPVVPRTARVNLILGF